MSGDSDTTITREATARDTTTLIEMRELMLREMGVLDEEKLASLRSKSLPYFEAALADGRFVGFLVEQDGKALGAVTMSYLEIHPQLNAQSGKTASIFGLYVNPAIRGRGVATSLVRQCVDKAKAEGVELVTLHAAPKARPLYERIGFETSPEMRYFVR